MKSQFTFLWLFLLMLSTSLSYGQTQIVPVAGSVESYNVGVGDLLYDPGGPTPAGVTCNGGSGTVANGYHPNCGCATVSTLTGATEVDFNFLEIFGNFDYIQIFDGTSPADPEIMDTRDMPSGTQTVASLIAFYGSTVFSGTSGNITVRFWATTVVNRCGFEIEVSDSSGGGGGGDDSDVENDLCSNAIALSCGQTITGTTANSNPNTLPACDLAPYGGGIWYSIEGTGGDIEVSTCSPSTNFDTQIGIFTGSCNNLSCVAGNNNDSECTTNSRQSTVTFASDLGTTYYIYLTGVAGARGNFGMTVTCPVAPEPGCTNTSPFATRVAPTSPVPVVITTCAWAGDYHTITGAIAGRTYAFTSSVSTDFLTVRQGTSSGPVIGTGVGSVSATPTANASIYVHINTNAACGTQNSCRTTTMACSSCTAVVGCANTTSYQGADAPTNTDVVTMTTCLFPGEYTTAFDAVSSNTYTISASNASNYLTVRQGTPTGSIIGSGIGSVSVTPTADGDLFVHLNTNASCGTAVQCNTMTIQCTTCVPPVSPDCSGAVALGCGDSVSGSTLDANVNSVPDCGGLDASVAPGVWYAFSSASNVEATLVACGNFNVQMAIYSGSCSDLECVASSLQSGPGKPCSGRNREAIAVFDAFAGETYYIYVTGTPGVGAAGDFTLNVASCEIFLQNDNCANALPIACGQTIIGSTVGATSASVPFCNTGLSTAPGVWYTFTGNGADATLSLCGSSYDTKIGIFSGSCGSLVCVGGNDDDCGLQSERTVTTTAGTTYYVYVTGFSSAAGAFTLNLACGALPCVCSNTASFGTVNAPTTNVPVTISTCSWATERATVNNAVAGQTYTFTISDPNGYITVRSGTPGGPVLGCGTTPVSVVATANGPIYPHWNTNSACGTATTCRVTTVACSSCAPPPPPVGCATAEAIACGDVVSGSTAGLPVNTTTPTCGTTLGTAPAKWYSFTSTGTSVTVSLCGSGYDTKVGVFTGTCANLTCVAGNDDSCGLQSEVTFASTVGTQYLVIVTGFGTGNGAYDLEITCTSTLDDETASRSGSNSEDAITSFNVGNFFPNPVTTSTVMVQIESPSNTEGVINVIDQTGRIIDSNKLFLGKGTNNKELDVTKYPAGTYVATIIVDDEITQRKFVVIK